MRRNLLLLVCAALLGGLACRDVMSPERTPLVGEWAAPPEAISGGGVHRVAYRFDPGGTFHYESSMHGMYGMPSVVLTSFFRIDGYYAVRCGRLFLQADIQSTWDRFYGAESPVQVQRLPRSVEGTADQCAGGIEFTRSGDQLVFRYMGPGPADEPVEYTLVLTRVP